MVICCKTNQIKSNLSLYSLDYAEACNELARPISASLRPGNTAPFEEMSQRWRAVGNTVSDLTGPRFEPQTSRSRDERVTAWPTKYRKYDCILKSGDFHSYVPRSVGHLLFCTCTVSTILFTTLSWPVDKEEHFSFLSHSFFLEKLVFTAKKLWMSVSLELSSTQPGIEGDAPFE